MSALPASRIEAFDVTIPANTAKAAPVEVDTAFAQAVLSGVEVVFPDGCLGLVGVQVAFAHDQLIPSTRGAWLIGNDDTLSYPLTGQPNNGALSVLGYNLDSYDHTVHVRYSVTDFAYVAAPVTQQAPVLPPLS